MRSNSVEELPSSWQSQVNKTTWDNFYIKFVTDDVLLKEAHDQGLQTDTPADLEEKLHL